MALLLAWPDVEITGITTVVENEGKRAAYARFALDLVGRLGVPVASGADVNFGCFREAYGLPPEERYWPAPIRPSPGPIDAALDLLQASIDVGATVIAIGPLTNLSLLERREPGILRKARLCVMGGHIQSAPVGYPVWGYRDDFNLQADRFAAKHVFDSTDPVRLTLVPIEVTAQTALRGRDLPALKRAGPLCRLIARQAENWVEDERIAVKYVQSCQDLPGDIINFQHDPLTCAVALGWDGAVVAVVPFEVDLEEDWLHERVSPRGRPIQVVTEIDRDRFNDFWVNRVTLQR